LKIKCGARSLHVSVLLNKIDVVTKKGTNLNFKYNCINSIG